MHACAYTDACVFVCEHTWLHMRAPPVGTCASWGLSAGILTRKLAHEQLGTRTLRRPGSRWAVLGELAGGRRPGFGLLPVSEALGGASRGGSRREFWKHIFALC